MVASNSSVVALIVAVVASVALGIETAYAAIGPAQPAGSTAATTMPACDRLPSSQREFCRSQAGSAALGTTHATVDQSASAAAAAAMAACSQLPLSQRGICQDQAGYGQPVLRRTMSRAQQAALN